MAYTLDKFKEYIKRRDRLRNRMEKKKRQKWAKSALEIHSLIERKETNGFIMPPIKDGLAKTE